jgi:hypothetical protein
MSAIRGKHDPAFKAKVALTARFVPRQVRQFRRYRGQSQARAAAETADPDRQRRQAGAQVGFMGLEADRVVTVGPSTQTQDIIGSMAEMGVQRMVEVSASEPLFGVGDYRATLDRLAKIASSSLYQSP